MYAGLEAYDHAQPGDPRKGASLIFEALTGTGRCEGQRAAELGSEAHDIVSGHIEQYRTDIEGWRDVSTITDWDV